SEIYVRNFQNMLADPNFTPDELSAISFGYAKLMSESSDVLQDLKNVVNITGMSLTDAERLAIIDNAYRSLLNYRNLVNYYTRKNISVSYLRAKKKNDTDRVLALYGSADERYW
ncbi:conjugal transfer protein TraI, partial [Bacteroides finegoldii]